MTITRFDQYADLANSGCLTGLTEFVHQHPQGNFFQQPAFFKFIEAIPGYTPKLWVATDDKNEIAGSLLGVLQSNGKALKSWLSRRMICWGGPLAATTDGTTITNQLLAQFKRDTATWAIYTEFRNFHDPEPGQHVFSQQQFTYKPHLNFMVKTDELTAVKKRMSKSRWRQIKSSLKLGATIEAPQSESEVGDFYEILQQLYREKVKKPLPNFELFRQFWQSDLAKIFLVKYEGEVVGGILCPVYRNEVIYEWYVCGKDGEVKGLYPSVLATWAPIEYGLQNGFDHFDFMGAGKPNEDYGVREFKARFGGEQVCFGRYEMILNRPLYEVGKLGLQLYKKIS